MPSEENIEKVSNVEVAEADSTVTIEKEVNPDVQTSEVETETEKTVVRLHVEANHS